MRNVTFIYKKEKLFDRVVTRSLLLSRSLQRKELAITDEMKDYVFSLFCEAGRNVLRKTGSYVRGMDVPYIQSGEGENVPEANSISFTLNIYEFRQNGVIVPLVDTAIQKYIEAFVLQEWLKFNGIQPIEDVEEYYTDIKRSMEYGMKIKQKYRYY